MNAVTAAGGPSDDPEVEGAAVPVTEPETDAEPARAEQLEESGPADGAPHAEEAEDLEAQPAGEPADPSGPQADARSESPAQPAGEAAEPGAEADTRPGVGVDAPAGTEAEAGRGTRAGVQPEVQPEAGAPAGGEADPGGVSGAGVPRVPSWARGGGSDAERASQFVALKELDTAPPVVPEPQPHPAPTPRPAVEPAEPVPPLELLAELTNTAETPRRTALRRVKVWTPILLLLAGGFTGVQLLRPLPAVELVGAEAAHTIDGQFTIPWPAAGQGAVRVAGSGDIGTFGEQKPVPTASVAKVMTAYVILKGHPLRKADAGPDIVVDAKAVADGTSEHESRIEGLTAGTKFSQQDMLKMLMIPSGNNVARLLARWDTDTSDESAFVVKMNEAAQELGMKDTVYTDPSGLDAGTVSTAVDQLKLAEAVMKDEAFRAVVAMPNATVKGLPKPIYNNNDTLLQAAGLSIRGIKTGSSTPAGGALMWAAYKSVGDETPLILGTMMEQRAAAPDPDAINSLALVKANSRKVIEAVREALAAAPVVRKGQTVGYVDDGLGGRTPLVAVQDLNVVGVPGQQLRLSLGAGASPVPRTAKDGTQVGVLTVGDGDGAKSVPVAVRGDLSEPSFGARLTRLGQGG